MAKTNADTTEATEQETSYKNVSAKLTEDEHFAFTTYARVMDHKAGDLAGQIVREWMAQNVTPDALRDAIAKKLGV